MVDIELIEFSVPNGSCHSLYIPSVSWAAGEDDLHTSIYQHFSQFGLINQVTVNKENCDETVYYCYIRFYSSRAASMARARCGAGFSLRGEMMKLARNINKGGGGKSGCRVPLARYYFRGR